MANTPPSDLFASLISDIKSYTGSDPLHPWIRGVRKMRESLSPDLLAEKLPRFLQKCAQTFESDQRYRNDLRFIRIWLHLMDYVDDPKAVLRTMQTKRIGTKRCLFYQAYALYYEKMKKFEEADQIYRLGVQNFAEPLDDLQKSYEKFLQRVEHHKTKRNQRMEKRVSKGPLPDRSNAKEHGDCLQEQCTRAPLSSLHDSLSEREHDVSTLAPQKLSSESSRKKMPLHEQDHKGGLENSNDYDASANHPTKKCTSRGVQDEKHGILKIKPEEPRKLHREDTVVMKFVDNAIVEGSEAEDACHHGLVDPTINMKEAMNAISSMFREPIEPAVATRKALRRQPEVSQNPNSGFEVFVDENLDGGIRTSNQEVGLSASNPDIPKMHQRVQQPLQIYADDEEDQNEIHSSAEKSPSRPPVDGFLFLRPDDQQSDSSNDANAAKSSKPKFREDTVVRRFVGSTTLDDEPEVENICHHGLVDPTVNLKEAMDDINGMFGKPMDFVRMTRKKKLEKTASLRKDFGGFSILPDDDLVSQHQNQPSSSSGNGEGGHDMFEPTVYTKQAMDDINKMFAMPLDF